MAWLLRHMKGLSINSKMSKDYLISLLIHLGLFAVIVIFSASTGKAKLPKPGEFVKVGLLDKVPAKQPAFKQPVGKFDDGGFEPEPVKLAYSKKKVEIKKPKEAKKKPEEKPEPLAKDQEKPNKEGAGLEIGSGAGEFAEGNFTNGPLGEYYLAYDFNYAISMIRRNWDNPITSHAELSCIIFFQITKDGNIQGVVVEEPSRDRIFDSYAKRAVEATKKLPALPQDFPENEVLTVHLTFRHRP